MNLFGNPEQVFNDFRRVEISRDGRAGRANPLRGPSRWNVDLSLGKTTTIKENLKVTFLADFFNAFNNVVFANPTLDLNQSAAFGVLTGQLCPRIDLPEAGGFSLVFASNSDSAPRILIRRRNSDSRSWT